MRAPVLRALLVSMAAGCGSPAPGSPPAPPAPPPPVDAGGEPIAATYTAEQATQGQRVFGGICSACHSRNDFVGPIFALTWMAEPVGSIFEHISTAMPQDRPGSLSPEQYASVVAYLLQLNGRPAGDRELPADAAALARMRW